MAARRNQRGVQANAWQKRKPSSPVLNPMRLLVAFIMLCFLIAVLLLNKALQTASQEDASLAAPNDKTGLASSKTGGLEKQKVPQTSSGGLRRPLAIKSESKYLDYLIDLALMPTTDLAKKIEQDDIFQIASLLESCPFADDEELPAWVPPAPPKKHAEPFVWYEHVSKAGGTSFCELAQHNMPKSEIPPYYCMPRDEEFKPNDPDGRVGRWDNDKLGRYRAKHPRIRLVSNEWQPFPSERLALSDLLLVTTLRNPMDRLLSAYHFWGVLHNQAAIKPTLTEWLHRTLKRSVGKDPQDWAFAVHIARYNFITWKFSNGTMPQGKTGAITDFPEAVPLEEDSLWLKPFSEAVENLAKFDVVLILELMSSHSKNMLTSSLGWTDFEKSHVVPSGKVENNHADTALKTQEYETMWEANRFDMLLYHWMKAVHLVRLQCPTFT